MWSASKTPRHGRKRRHSGTWRCRDIEDVPTTAELGRQGHRRAGARCHRVAPGYRRSRRGGWCSPRDGSGNSSGDGDGLLYRALNVSLEIRHAREQSSSESDGGEESDEVEQQQDENERENHGPQPFTLDVHRGVPGQRKGSAAYRAAEALVKTSESAALEARSASSASGSSGTHGSDGQLESDGAGAGGKKTPLQASADKAKGKEDEYWAVGALRRACEHRGLRGFAKERGKAFFLGSGKKKRVDKVRPFQGCAGPWMRSGLIERGGESMNESKRKGEVQQQRESNIAGPLCEEVQLSYIP